MSSDTISRRILLFLKPGDHWKSLLVQWSGVFSTDAEKEKWTGQYPRYPLQGTDLFRHDCFRFIDKQKNFVGDVYVFFNLHEGEKTDTIYIAPRKNSGGIDFARNDPKNKFLRWVPLPLPIQFDIQPDKPCKTYIVMNHPEDACKHIVVGKKHEENADRFAEDPIWQSRRHRLRLIGNHSEWCKEKFFCYNTNPPVLGNSLMLDNFFQFIRSWHRIHRF